MLFVEGGNPEFSGEIWTPAFAGVTSLFSLWVFTVFQAAK